MGVLKIFDTGYIKTDNSGTQASSSDRAYSGTAITLKTASFIPVLKKNINNNPELAPSVSFSEVNQGSLENMQFTLRCVLNMDVSTDMDLVQYLLDCVRTQGYKLLWYDYSDATVEKNNGQLIYRIAQNSNFGDALTNGEKTAFGISDNFYTLHVLFTEMNPKQTSKTLINYELKGFVLKVEGSTI